MKSQAYFTRHSDHPSDNHSGSETFSPRESRLRRIAWIVSVWLGITTTLVTTARAQTVDNIANQSQLNAAILSIQNNQSTDYTLNFTSGFSLNQIVPNIISNATITLAGNSNSIDGASTYQPFVINSGTVVVQDLNIINSTPAITVNGGTLDTTTDSLIPTISNSGSVNFSAGVNGTIAGDAPGVYSGVISGLGNVEINNTNGNGPVSFTGLNSYTGGTTIDANAGLIGTTDSLQGNISNSGTLQFYAGANGNANGDPAGTYSSVISGTGSVEISSYNNSGPVTFTGLNSYSGGTTIDSGATLIGTTDTLQGLIYNFGAVQMTAGTLGAANGDPAGTYSGVMSGAGSLEISGTGPITLTGLNSYNGGTTIDSGATLIGTTDSLQGTITNSGTVQFYAGTNGSANFDPPGVYSGAISGAGNVEISGTSAITFTGPNSYTGGTTIDSAATLIGTTESLQGNITNGGVLQFYASGQAAANGTPAGTYSGVISGGGSVEISGLGPVTFTGLNSYTGGTSVDQNSTLIGTTDSLQGNFANSGTIQFTAGTLGNANGDAAGTYSGVISGTGGVEISGSTAVTFTGLNSCSGGTLVDGTATLIGTTDSLQGSFNNYGLIQLAAGTQGSAGGDPAGTYSGVISNSGGLEITGTGPVTLTGLNSYTGGTMIDQNATLIGTTDSLQGSIYNYGSVQFNAGTLGSAGGDPAGTYSGVISGTGSVEISNSSSNGPVTFTGLNSYSGGTTVDQNATLIGTTDSLQGNIYNLGAIQFNAGTHGAANGDPAGYYSGIISGSGSVEISNSSSNGPVTFVGLNSYTGGTTVDLNATLIGTTDSLQGNITNNGQLQFYAGTHGDASGDAAGTYSGVISGTGGVEISGTSAVTFSGANTYSGGTLVDAHSTLIGTTTSVQGNINNNWLVEFNQSTSGTYAGMISGAGGVEITGGGAVTLTGNNAYTGATLIDTSTSLIGTTSSLQGTMYNYGAVQFNQSGSGTYAGAMSGTGSVEISGGGTLTFSGANAYTGGTMIDSGSTLIGTTTSLQGGIADSGTLKFIQSTNGNFSGNLTGTGSLEVGGGGSITLSGMNTYTGGTTVDNSTTLISTTDSLAGTIVNNGAVQFYPGQNGTYAGNMSGTGSVEISGGTVTFSGVDTYSGGTTVDNGSALSGTTSNLQGNIVDNGLVQFYQGGSGTYGGNMSGIGSLEISGGGLLTLSGTNSYSGGTYVDHGSTLIGTTTSLQGSIIDSGTVQFNQNTNGTYAGIISGQGGVVVNGTGPLTLTAANTYSGGTTVNSGSKLIGTTSSLQGVFVNDGAVQFDQSSSGTFAGFISGTGNVEISGGGQLTFSGLNSYTGGTTVDSGNTLIGTTGSLQGNFVNDGAVEFNQSSSGTYGGNMSGTGSVEISGTGPVTFSGVNSYTGGTTIDQGSTLVGTTSSLLGSITDKGTLQFNQNTSGTFGGSISGTGGVDISGTGQVIFSGMNTYTGITKVDSGATLTTSSTGSIAGPITINNGGTLMGSGTYGATTINGGGTIYPGTVGAPMTINGNFVQNTGSTFSAEVSPTGSDKIIVNGTAQVATGTTLNLVVDSGSYTIGHKYTLLTASGGLTGTYSTVVTSSVSDYVMFTQQYTPNSLQLTVNSDLSRGALTSNQLAVASAIDQSSSSATGSYANIITQLTTLNSGQLTGALNQMSGDIYSSLGNIERQTTTAQLQLVSNRLAGMTGPGIPAVAARQRNNNIRFVSAQGNTAPDPDEPPMGSNYGSMAWSGWAQGYGLGGNIAGDGNAGGTNYRLGGTLFGLERWLGDNTMIGVLGGYAGTTVGNRLDSSSAQISSYQVGLYELHRQDSFYISNIDAYTNDAFNVSRPINFGTVQQTASSNSSGNQWSHYTEGGATLDFDDLRLQPFLGLQYMYLDQQAAAESGAGSLNLTTSQQTISSVRNAFGVRLSQETMWGKLLVIPSLAARYLHEWGDGNQLISSSMSGAPTVQFATAGNQTGRDFGIFTLGANAYVSDRFSIYATIDNQVSTSFYALIGSGGFQYSW